MWKDNWLAYLIMVIVMLHFIAGFGWVAWKMSKKAGDGKKNNSGDQSSASNASN